MQKFLKLKELAKNTVGSNYELFTYQLNSLLSLYKQLANEVVSLQGRIESLIVEIDPKALSLAGIGPLSATAIYAE